MENQQPHIRLSDNSYLPVEEFLSSTLSSLYDYAIFTVDSDLVINCWSTGAARQLGYEAKEVIGQPMEIIYTDTDRVHHVPLQDRKQALKEGKAVGNRWYLAKEGSRFFAYGLLYPIKDKMGRILGFVKILRDITQRKIAEDAINRHVKELEELITHKEKILSLLSHDLRSPLSTIIGITNYLQSDLAEMDHDDLKKMLAILHHTSSEELKMLDYLVKWARIKHASDVFSPHVLGLKELVEEVMDTFHEMAASKAISINNEILPEMVVFADRMMILSVFQNLISNAVKFTGAGGTIIISAVSDFDKVMVNVKDSGIGISAERLAHIFEPQFKSLTNARGPEKGAGIGLLLVKEFINKNNGDIYVESVEGIGTTFYFTLPREDNTFKHDTVTNSDYWKKG